MGRSRSALPPPSPAPSTNCIGGSTLLILTDESAPGSLKSGMREFSPQLRFITRSSDHIAQSIPRGTRAEIRDRKSEVSGQKIQTKESLCRQYAMFIKDNAGITDGDKVNIGVRPENPNREPIECPQTSP